MEDLSKPSFEVILTPALIPLYDLKGKTAIIIDILRATSSMCVAFEYGVRNIIPVSHVEDAIIHRKSGLKAAAERDGQKVDGFDFGNSPFDFMIDDLNGQSLVMTTTNGTKAIHLSSKAEKMYIGSFLNLQAVADKIITENKPVVAICSGWKDRFNLEDALFAGALASQVSHVFDLNDDSTIAAIALWNTAQSNLEAFMKNASHAQRFERLGIDRDIQFCLQQSIYPFVPEVANGMIKIDAETGNNI